jgi:hypothetical protein
MKYIINNSNLEKYINKNKIIDGMLVIKDFTRYVMDFEINVPEKQLQLKVWGIKSFLNDLSYSGSFILRIVLENWIDAYIEFEISNYSVYETKQGRLLIEFENCNIARIKGDAVYV